MERIEHEGADLGENISRTLPLNGASVTPESTRCGFVVSGEGEAVRFCDAPAPRGSSYCVRHRALCQVRPGTKAAAAILAELAREAARPGAGADTVPEAPEATDADDALAALDLRPRELGEAS
jgi:hypothetical protein